MVVDEDRLGSVFGLDCGSVFSFTYRSEDLGTLVNLEELLVDCWMDPESGDQ